MEWRSKIGASGDPLPLTEELVAAIKSANAGVKPKKGKKMKARASFRTLRDQIPEHLRNIVDEYDKQAISRRTKEIYGEITRRFLMASLLDLVSREGYGNKRAEKHIAGIREICDKYTVWAYDDTGKEYELSGKHVRDMADLMERELRRNGIDISWDKESIVIGKKRIGVDEEPCNLEA